MEGAKRSKTGGRSAGTPNRRTLAARLQLAETADPLAFLTRVLNGDEPLATMTDRMAAAKELRRVLIPDCRERPLSFDLPPVTSPADLPAAFGAMLSAVSDETLTPSEAKAVTDLLEGTRKAFETADLAERIAKLEARTA